MPVNEIPNQLRKFSSTYKKKEIESAITSLTYDYLQELFKILQLPENNDLQYLISEDNINICLKKTELFYRRYQLNNQVIPKGDLAKKKIESVKFLSIFDENGILDKSFRLRNFTQEELKHPIMKANCPVDVGERTMVPKLSHFLRNFVILSQCNLSQILTKRSLAMGGSVALCLLRLPPKLEEIHYLLD